MILARSEAVAACDSASIWQAWADVPNWPNWDPDLASAGIEGPFQLGAKGRLKPKSGPAATFVITGFVAGASFECTTLLPLGTRIVVDHRLEGEGAMRRLVHEAHAFGPLALVVRLLLGPSLRKAIAEAVRTLAGTPKGALT